MLSFCGLLLLQYELLLLEFVAASIQFCRGPGGTIKLSLFGSTNNIHEPVIRNLVLFIYSFV